MSTALALKDVCKLLGLQPYQIQHAYSVGAVPEPRTRISGRRVFEPSDVHKLAKHFKVTLKADASVAAESAE
jgi:DNA-binding transcriptional MerR regulator